MIFVLAPVWPVLTRQLDFADNEPEDMLEAERAKFPEEHSNGSSEPSGESKTIAR